MNAPLPRVPLYERLPEIYRVRDAEQSPPGQLKAYLGAIELAFGALHEHVEQLHDDLFIDTCDDWVIPYLADLLGTSHLKGDVRTLRADVADTIALRRRKGTLGAIERLAENLTGWACRAVEMRPLLARHQHLNHQRPAMGGTVPIRDPAALAQLGTPFDRFAHTADVRTPDPLPYACTRHINLPNVAVFLWRLLDLRLPFVQPLAKGSTDLGPQPAGVARHLIRIDLHPLDLPMRLFNARGPGRHELRNGVAALRAPDSAPGPMIDARLTSPARGNEDGHPEAYVAIDFFDDAAVPPRGFDLGDPGLHLFLPGSEQPVFATTNWVYRGDNLCAWEAGLRRALVDGEIVIDPDIGRLLIGLGNIAQRNALVDAAGTAARFFVSFTYGAPAAVGAHPVSRETAPLVAGTDVRRVSGLPGGSSLQSQLNGLDTAGGPVELIIADSLVHELDLAAIPGTVIDGGFALRLRSDLTIRAAGGQRPIVRLARPLAFRPVDAAAANIQSPRVRLEGLYLDAGPGMAAAAPLIDRAALARLEIVGCTLAPGGQTQRDGSRAPLRAAMRLANGYGFSIPADEAAFLPTPDIVIQRSICGALAADDRYRIELHDSIVDAGSGAGDPAPAPGAGLAIGAATDAVNAWGPALVFNGVTLFGAARIGSASGQGGLFTQRFEVLNHQQGCIKQSSFAPGPNRLPPNHGCVFAPDARQVFTSERFNDPAYAQLALRADARIRTQGPGDDAMGAYGFTLEAHKWVNLRVRLGEFLPVGSAAQTVPVT